MDYPKFKEGQVFVSTPKSPNGKFLYKVYEQKDNLVVLNVFIYTPVEYDSNTGRFFNMTGCSKRIVDATIIGQLLQDKQIEEREDGEFLYDSILGKFNEIADVFDNDFWHEVK